MSYHFFLKMCFVDVTKSAEFSELKNIGSLPSLWKPEQIPRMNAGSFERLTSSVGDFLLNFVAPESNEHLVEKIIPCIYSNHLPKEEMQLPL